MKSRLDEILFSIAKLTQDCRDDIRYAVPEIEEELAGATTHLLSALLEIGTRQKNG